MHPTRLKETRIGRKTPLKHKSFVRVHMDGRRLYGMVRRNGEIQVVDDWASMHPNMNHREYEEWADHEAYKERPMGEIPTHINWQTAMSVESIEKTGGKAYLTF